MFKRSFTALSHTANRIKSFAIVHKKKLLIGGALVLASSVATAAGFETYSAANYLQKLTGRGRQKGIPTEYIDVIVPVESIDGKIVQDRVIQVDVQTRKLVEKLFRRYSSTEEPSLDSDTPLDQLSWSISDFQKFLSEEQGEVYDQISAYQLALRIKQRKLVTAPSQQIDIEKISSLRLNFEDLMVYLLSPLNEVTHPCINTVYQDMTQPLSHYLIASSHNTYLEGDQLLSRSSVEAYRKVLLNSCRCIEIDCHNGPQGEPIVYHGKTLTAPVPLKAVLNEIRKHSFTASPYPLIISLEIHCNLQQQERMADLIDECFGDILVPALDPEEPLPSPQDLRGKVLLQGELADEDTSERNPKCRSSTLIFEPRFDYGAIPIKFPGDLARETGGESDDSSNDENEPLVVGIWNRRLYDMFAFRAAPFLSAVENVVDATRQLNLSETSAVERIKQFPHVVREWNSHKLTRIYPKGTRIFSGNYSPLFYWGNGCQLVSLNWQRNDKFMRIQRGKFRDNGNCGYVLQERFIPDENRKLAGSIHPSSSDVMTSDPVRIRVVSYLQIDGNNGNGKGQAQGSNGNSKAKVSTPSDLYCNIEVTSDRSLWKVQQVTVTFAKLLEDVVRLLEDEFQSLKHAVGISTPPSTNRSSRFKDEDYFGDAEIEPAIDELDTTRRKKQQQKSSNPFEFSFMPSILSTRETLLAENMTGILSFVLYERKRRKEPLASYSMPMHALRTGWRFVPLGPDDRHVIGGMLVRISQHQKQQQQIRQQEQEESRSSKAE